MDVQSQCCSFGSDSGVAKFVGGYYLKLSTQTPEDFNMSLGLTVFGLFYFQDGSVRADNTSVIPDVYRSVNITVNCKEDLESEQAG